MTDSQITLQPGDVVRVKPERLGNFYNAFAAKIRDRDAVVEKVVGGPMLERVWVVFQKRAGRGTTFRERMRHEDLYLVAAAEQQPEQTK